MFEISRHPFRRLDQKFHEGGCLFAATPFAGGPVGIPAQLGFQVPAQVLVGVGSQASTAEIEDFDLIFAPASQAVTSLA